MSKFRSRTTSRLTKAGIAAGGITGILLATTAIPAFAAVPGTLSVSSGPSGGGNTVTLTTAAGSAPFTTASPVVEFQAVTAANAGCSTFYKAAANVTASTATPFTSTAGVVVAPAAGSPGGPTRLTTNKLVIPIPVGVSPTGVALVGSQTSSKFYICVYDSTSLTTSTLLSSATYAIAAQPTLLTATASGPALGGNTVTITGTGFINGATTVSIGGSPATNVVVNTAGTILTATAPSHAPGGSQTISVSTTGGTVTNAAINGPGGVAGTIPAYTFANGITVSPNTSPNTTNPALDITGAGFSSLTWATDLDSTGVALPIASGNAARVALTDNVWNAQSLPGTYATTTVYPVAQCGSVLPISDGEIICTLNLADKLTYASSALKLLTGTPVPSGSYQITVANTDAASGLTSGSFNFSTVSSGATFTVSPF